MRDDRDATQRVLDVWGRPEKRGRTNMFGGRVPPSAQQKDVFAKAKQIGMTDEQAALLADCDINPALLQGVHTQGRDFPSLLDTLLMEQARRGLGSGRKGVRGVGNAQHISIEHSMTEDQGPMAEGSPTARLKTIAKMMQDGLVQSMAVQAPHTPPPTVFFPADVGSVETFEGAGIIRRMDKYRLSVDGVRYTATEEQEKRIRGLTPEQRANFHEVMGNAEAVKEIADKEITPPPEAKWVVRRVDKKGHARTVQNLNSGIEVRRSLKSTTLRMCGSLACLSPRIDVDTPYVGVTERTGSAQANYHPKCAEAEGLTDVIKVMFPEGTPETPTPNSTVQFVMDNTALPEITVPRGGIKFPDIKDQFTKDFNGW